MLPVSAQELKPVEQVTVSPVTEVLFRSYQDHDNITIYQRGLPLLIIKSTDDTARTQAQQIVTSLNQVHSPLTVTQAAGAYQIQSADQVLLTLTENIQAPLNANLQGQPLAMQLAQQVSQGLDLPQPQLSPELMTPPKTASALQQITEQITNFIVATFEGRASWYGGSFEGRRSASGLIHSANLLTAAHRSLPFGTRVMVTNLNNGRKVIVKVTDRGPFIGGRVLDVSRGAASALGMIQSGVAKVRVDVLGLSR